MTRGLLLTKLSEARGRLSDDIEFRSYSLEPQALACALIAACDRNDPITARDGSRPEWPPFRPDQRHTFSNSRRREGRAFDLAEDHPVFSKLRVVPGPAGHTREKAGARAFLTQ